MTKRFLGMLTIMLLSTAGAGAVGKTTLTSYASYWHHTDDSYGAGLKLSKSLLDLVYVDGRAGYTEADAIEMLPFEASLNVGLPGLISPYAGIGAGYYVVDSDRFDNLAGYYGQCGLEFIFTKVGASAELRYLDLEGSYFDGVSLNLGVLWKF